MAALQEVGTDAATIFYQKRRVFSPKREKKTAQMSSLFQTVSSGALIVKQTVPVNTL